MNDLNVNRSEWFFLQGEISLVSDIFVCDQYNGSLLEVGDKRGWGSDSLMFLRTACIKHLWEEATLQSLRKGASCRVFRNPAIVLLGNFEGRHHQGRDGGCWLDSYWYVTAKLHDARFWKSENTPLAASLHDVRKCGMCGFINTIKNVVS